MTSRILWLNPVFGVAGDMLLGALLDLGADEQKVRSDLETMQIPGWDLVVEPVKRRGLASRRAHVEAELDAHRSWSEIDERLASASMEASVGAGARSTFRALAEVEARAHGVGINEVHFHEVGAVDAIVDIVGCWSALRSLDVRNVVSGPVGLGSGMITTSHGRMPHPAPAVLGLLEGIPVTSVETPSETATPTGVALLKTMVTEWGDIPAGRLVTSGFGAGGRDPESHANILAGAILENDDATRVEAVLVETNVDDVTPEVIAYVIESALRAGADDAWSIPVVMKKGRPGHEIRILCASAMAGALSEILARETGTLGIRSYPVTKQVLPRTFDTVLVDGHEISIKSGPYGAKPEFEDVKSVAVRTGRPVAEVSRAAYAAWRSLTSPSLEHEEGTV